MILSNFDDFSGIQGLFSQRFHTQKPVCRYLVQFYKPKSNLKKSTLLMVNEKLVSRQKSKYRQKNLFLKSYALKNISRVFTVLKFQSLRMVCTLFLNERELFLMRNDFFRFQNLNMLNQIIFNSRFQFPSENTFNSTTVMRKSTPLKTVEQLIINFMKPFLLHFSTFSFAVYFGVHFVINLGLVFGEAFCYKRGQNGTM